MPVSCNIVYPALDCKCGEHDIETIPFVIAANGQYGMIPFHNGTCVYLMKYLNKTAFKYQYH